MPGDFVQQEIRRLVQKIPSILAELGRFDEAIDMIKQGREIFEFEEALSFSPTHAILNLMHASFLIKQEKDLD